MKVKIQRTLAITATALVLCGAFSSMVAEADTFTMNQDEIMVDGMIFSKPYGFVNSGTTYMPLWYVMQALKSVGVQNTWNGKTWDIQFNNAELSPLNQSQDAHTITVNGQFYAGFPAIAAIDPASNQMTTYIPVWYIMQVLNTLGFMNTWNGETWSLGRLTWGVFGTN